MFTILFGLCGVPMLSVVGYSLSKAAEPENDYSAFGLGILFLTVGAVGVGLIARALWKAGESDRAMVRDRNPDVRRRAGSSDSASILAQLAEDPEPAVRNAVALNRATPVELLRALARDQAEPVVAAVLVNARNRRFGEVSELANRQLRKLRGTHQSNGRNNYVTTERQMQHEWYGGHSELSWRDREMAQIWGMDADTYVSNLKEHDPD
jgi:hypothetical protein